MIDTLRVIYRNGIWFFSGLLLSNIVSGNPLDMVMENVKNKFPGIDHISIERWAELSKNQLDDWLIIDVRKTEEYQKSHIAGAILVSPDASVEKVNTVIAQYFSSKKKKPSNILFYCSVGYRSSALIVRLQKSMSSPRDLRLYNLEGGIFSWANNGLPVSIKDEQGNNIHIEGGSPADVIHPYNWLWGRLLD